MRSTGPSQKIICTFMKFVTFHRSTSAFFVIVFAVCVNLQTFAVEGGKNKAAANGQPPVGNPAVPTKTIFYGDESRQWMNIYIAENHSHPTPVYIYSHANASTANAFPKGIWGDVSKAGISVVSWESIPNVKTGDHVAICEADFNIVLNWVQSHAKEYNFDVNKIVVGGMSRGSVVTWKTSHERWKEIRGIYSTNALPAGAWAGGSTRVLDYITKDSPPIFLAYESYPNVPREVNGHDPIYGIAIADRYKELGIGDRATVVHSIETTNKSFGTVWGGLIEFVTKVTPGNPSAASRSSGAE